MTVECKLPGEIREYIDIVRSGEIPVCKEQIALCDYVERCFSEEKIYVDTKQLTNYLDKQKFFPFRLLPWEVFIFALHNCTYRSPGVLRWPDLLILVGRGAGKNGYISYEGFCWLLPVNGIKKYHTDIYATSEKQAQTSFYDIREVLEENRGVMEKYFEWNMEVIRNKRTGSELRFHTSGYKTMDGSRPGANIYDEYHAYESYRLIDVTKTGLGKKESPRTTIATTDGKVRGGPLDDIKEQAAEIFFRGGEDNGLLPFICKLDDRREVDDPALWEKANPSLRHFPTLMQEMQKEYADFKRNPAGNASFMVKRMNLPMTFEDQSVTDWENILATNAEMPDLTGCPCVAGIDYARTTDFVAAGLLFFVQREILLDISYMGLQK